MLAFRWTKMILINAVVDCHYRLHAWLNRLSLRCYVGGLMKGLEGLVQYCNNCSTGGRLFGGHLLGIVSYRRYHR